MKQTKEKTKPLSPQLVDTLVRLGVPKAKAKVMTLKDAKRFLDSKPRKPDAKLLNLDNFINWSE